MNDWIWFSILCIFTLEVIFIYFRINSIKETSNSSWAFDKSMALILTWFISMIQLIILTKNTAIGDPMIWRWHMLLYELATILTIAICFISNHFINKLIIKFVKRDK